MKTKFNCLFVALTSLALPAVTQAQFICTTNNGTITITGYTGPGGDVTIPDIINGLPVTSIGHGAFAGCTSLTNVTIPNSITGIGEEAFAATSLTNVTIPNSVTNIGNFAFGNCANLTGMTMDADNPVYSSMNGVLFDKSQTTLIQYPGGKGGSYTIPNGVTSIGFEAFFDSLNLTNVTIPNSVTSIGDEAFVECGLMNVTIGNGVTNIGYHVFAVCGLNSVTIPNSVTSIGDEAFFECYSLTNVTIGNGVTSIGVWAFAQCYSLTTVTIGNSVTNIGAGAFRECSYYLTSVTIPSSVTSIGVEAFVDCYSLTSVYFKGNAPAADGTVFAYYSGYGYYIATAYYLPGTTGWADFSANTGITAMPWNPLIQTGDASFGVRTNQFGFNINWASGQTVVVEACTNLANPVWSPVTTNTLTGDSSYFSDPQWSNYPARFYRLRSP